MYSVICSGLSRLNWIQNH